MSTVFGKCRSAPVSILFAEQLGLLIYGLFIARAISWFLYLTGPNLLRRPYMTTLGRGELFDTTTGNVAAISY
jgi:hypothetical protein